MGTTSSGLGALLFCVLVSGSLACSSKQCAVDFSSGVRSSKAMAGQNAPYCRLVTAYRQCLEDTKGPCRGNIQFHTMKSLVGRKAEELNCVEVLKSAESQACLFPYIHTQAASHLICSLHGDPHLRTFDGEYESCGVSGAWPLVDNPYLAIQVTSRPRFGDSELASAISKITVIVKSVRGCTGEKMFAASSTEVLPRAFQDGTGTGVGDVARVRTMEDGGVDLLLDHVSTTVVVRRQGSWLSVSVHLPMQIVEERTAADSAQLCLSGCPAALRLSLPHFLAEPVPQARRLGLPPPAISKITAEGLCSSLGTRGPYLDTCVFDALLSGGDVALAESSLVTQSDISRLLRDHRTDNRSDLRLYDGLAVSGGTRTEAAATGLLAVLISLAF